MEKVTVLEVAEMAHQVNKAYCESRGDESQVGWDDAPDWQKESAINGVKFHFQNDVTPEQSHENWLKEKADDGWVYGIVKDVEKKEHPCMVEYGMLPIAQRSKDYIFKSIVDTFKIIAEEVAV